MPRFFDSLKCDAIFELLIGKKILSCKQLGVEEHPKGGSYSGIWWIDLPLNREANIRNGWAKPYFVFVQCLIWFFQMSWAQQNPKHIFSALPPFSAHVYFERSLFICFRFIYMQVIRMLFGPSYLMFRKPVEPFLWGFSLPTPGSGSNDLQIVKKLKKIVLIGIPNIPPQRFKFCSKLR